MAWNICFKTARVVVWLTVAGVLFRAPAAQARPLVSYDLDSLCAMSSDIVEADLTMLPTDKYGYGATSISVRQTFKGDSKAGEVVPVIALATFRKWRESSQTRGSFRADSLQVGDHLFVFLSAGQQPYGWEGPKLKRYNYVVGNGVKLVQDGQVLSFSQMSNPGPYVANSPMSEWNGAAKSAITPEFFRARLKQSLQASEKALALLKRVGAKPSPAQARQLVELLRRRPSQRSSLFEGDYINNQICQRLANSGDLPSLQAAIALPLTFQSRSLLGLGLGTPQGRNWLLARIGDKRETIARRMVFAQALEQSGPQFYNRIRNISGSDIGAGYAPKLGKESGNARFITRVAQLASTVQNEALSERLVRLVGNFASLSLTFVEDSARPALRPDVRGAMTTLRTLRNHTRSLRLRQEINEALYFGAKA